MISAQELIVDESKIKRAVQSGIPLTITTFTLPREMELYIEKVLTVFLRLAFFRLANREKIKNYLIYCVRELAVNAKKANTKRVYFMEKGLELNLLDEYKEGMKDFKKVTFNNIVHYLQLQKEKGLYIKISFQIKMNTLLIEIRNNVVITKMELIRIHDKIARSRQYGSMEEALGQAPDDSEGAGLGLVIVNLMLKKMGLDEDCFDISACGPETIARITIPLDQAGQPVSGQPVSSLGNYSALSGAIVDTVQSLPLFPENIITIVKHIADPNPQVSEISGKISMDPALTADLLKIVNSAPYITACKADSIDDAVKMAGIQGIKNLLLFCGARKILGEESPDKKALWEHSYKTAFYAYNLAVNFHRDKNIRDDAYTGGLLHDMGKIIFSAVHPELLPKAKDFCAQKNLPASTVEDLCAGMNHAEIGSLLAEKWSFPGTLVNAIRYHHDPSSALPESRDLVEAVYLANMFCEYEAKNIIFDQIDSAVLKNFGINEKKQVDALLERAD